MLSIRRHASGLITLALTFALGGVAMPQVSEAADAFTIIGPLAGRAVTSCSDITISGGTIDSAGLSSPSPANKGNVATNGNITLSGSSTIQGDATVGPGKRITTSGTAHVTGTSSVGTSVFDCRPIDLVALKTTLQSLNDNARIPLTGLHRNPLTGANHTDFVMSGTDTLALPTGTYYFTSFVVSGSSAITVTGPVHILCSGTVSMSGGGAHGHKRLQPSLLGLRCERRAEQRERERLRLRAIGVSELCQLDARRKHLREHGHDERLFACDPNDR